ncbi:pantoate--beta-alanine ligase, partial [Streptomyces sp. NPDC003487]
PWTIWPAASLKSPIWNQETVLTNWCMPTGISAAVRAAARAVLDEASRLDPPLELDYLALVDPDDFTEIGDDFTGEAVLAVAARVGSTRLIDNLPLTFGAAS